MKIIKPLTFNPFTFSRACEAIYLGESGLLETAGIDELRLGYSYDPDADTLSPSGAIIEGEATNRFLYSQVFEDAAWTNIYLNVTDDAATAPDGTTTAALIENTAHITSFPLIAQTFTWAAGAVISAYVKAAASGASVRLTLGTSTCVFRVNVGDFSALGANGTITALPDGWFRCELFATSPNGTAQIQWNGSDVYIWGAQVEVDDGSHRATSYIVTTTTAETRDADIVISQTPSLVSSNIEEDDAPIWDSGDSYVVGDKVMVLGEYHRVYEALENSTDKFPPDHTVDVQPTDPDWLDTGATNRWQMFDMLVGAEKQSLATVSGGNIDVNMQVDVVVNSVVLLNASGSVAKVTMRNGAAEIIYEREINLLGTALGTGWWQFFFGYRGGIKTIVLTDLPQIAPATIQVEIESGGGVAGLGKLIIGEAIEIGCARFGTTVGIIDFSRKERDPFGNNYIVERRYIDKVDYDIQIDSDKVDDVKDILTQIRAIPAVYIGSENKFKSTVVYGFYRDFSIVIAGSKKSSCAIQVEGI